MFLDTVKHIAIEKGTGAPIYAPWSQFPHTLIAHHGAACCDRAEHWLEGMDISQLSEASVYSGPRWLLEHFEWGPLTHPIHWCEAVRRKSLDCGALAAMTLRCFHIRGVDAYPAQIVQEYSQSALLHWERKWQDEESSTHWLQDNLIYHECVAMITANKTVKVWDSSSGWWLSPNSRRGYGGIRALRIHTPDYAEKGIMTWENMPVKLNEWQVIPVAE